MEGVFMKRREAKDLGLDRYTTGKPCKNGHYAERYVANCGCIQCDVEWHRNRPGYYTTEKRRAWYKQWREDNREHYRTYQREYQRRLRAAEKAGGFSL